MGKSSIDGRFSMAMLNNQMVSRHIFWSSHARRLDPLVDLLSHRTCATAQSGPGARFLRRGLNEHQYIYIYICIYIYID